MFQSIVSYFIFYYLLRTIVTIDVVSSHQHPIKCTNTYNFNIYHPFVIHRRGYGIATLLLSYRGGGAAAVDGGDINNNNNDTNDYDRAEKAIVDSIERVESFVERMIANEVDILFHKDNNNINSNNDSKQQQHETVQQHVKKAITDGVTKVKTSIKDHSSKHVYPFESNTSNNKGAPTSTTTAATNQHKDHRILHAIEAAERAVLHAIEKEVDTLFHHDHIINNHSKSDDNKKDHVPFLHQAKTNVQDGVRKASTIVLDQVHDHRRNWLHTVSQSMIEEYNMPDFFIE